MKSRIRLFSVLTTLFLTFVCLPASFAQNTSPKNLVRLIYFLPNDRAPQPGIDAKLDKEIKDAQLLFADLLEKHGFERKTFQFETDAHGNAVIHHVNGKFATAYYDNAPWSVWEELNQFDRSKNIYLVFLDVGKEAFASGGSGYGGWSNGGASGSALVTAYHPVTAHELGHAFGLNHDYYRYDLTDDWMIRSVGAAEWLVVNRYFNDAPTSFNTPAKIQMLQPTATPSHAIRLRFEVTDPDGSHQAQLLAGVHTSDDPTAVGFTLIDYKSFKGGNTVEFVTPALTGSPATAPTSVTLQVTDMHGNFAVHKFPINIATLLPSPEVVPIPDANLVAALRRGLGIAPGDPITQLDMVRLRRLTEGYFSQIADLTGLEHAVNLTVLNLSANKISDLRPLAGLTQLKHLNLANNEIRDVAPLTGLTNLTELNLVGNQIRDVSPLTALVNLKTLYPSGNPLTTIPDMAVVNLRLSSGESVVIESSNFVVYSGDPTRIVDSIRPNADLITVRWLDFDALLHSNNLTEFFEQGGILELLTLTDANFGDVVISEIMWGLNAGSTADQWIELYNTTSGDIMLDDGVPGVNWTFRFSFGNSREQENIQGWWKVVDRVSNLGWKVAGQSGNTSQNQPLISMYRDIDYETGSVPDGTLAHSWKASTGRVNLLPPSYGTPGAKHLPPSPGGKGDDLVADVNGDGVVNIQDLVMVASSFDQTSENNADVNGDGVVNIQDLVLVAAAFGDAPAAP